MKKKYDCWEYDHYNQMLRVFLDGEEIDGAELDTLVEDWLDDSGYELDDGGYEKVE